MSFGAGGTSGRAEKTSMATVRNAQIRDGLTFRVSQWLNARSNEQKVSQSDASRLSRLRVCLGSVLFTFRAVLEHTCRPLSPRRGHKTDQIQSDLSDSANRFTDRRQTGCICKSNKLPTLPLRTKLQTLFSLIVLRMPCVFLQESISVLPQRFIHV